MWLDKDGVVHTVAAPDPEVLLPPSLVKGLGSFLLRPYDDSILEDYRALVGLLERWQEALIDRVQGEAGQRTSSSDAEEPAPEIPEAIRSLLHQELFRQPSAVGIDRIDQVIDLVDDWEDLYLDHEKILGHVILRHHLKLEAPIGTHEELLDRHSALHRQ